MNPIYREQERQAVLDALGPRAKTGPMFESDTPLAGAVTGAFRNHLGYMKVTLLLDSTGTERTFFAHDLQQES